MKLPPTRLFIAVDLEGICGVVTAADVARTGAAAEAARRHLRADLDAVFAGCLDAGADQIVVCDAHDDGHNLDAEGLPPQVTLVSGSPAPLSMMQGVGADCAGALFVGYHARAGTAAAVLAHTWSERVFAVHSGECEVGELGLCALLAGSVGVPTLFASGDDKLAVEARALVPGIVTTVVKTGITRTSAGLCAPDEARSRLRRDAADAVSARGAHRPLAWRREPLRVTFTHVEYCDAAAEAPAARRLDGRTLELNGTAYGEVYRSFVTCMRLAETVR